MAKKDLQLEEIQTQAYFFPVEGVSIQAVSLEDALECLAKMKA